MSLLPLNSELESLLSQYLPKSNEAKPFVTLTYAQSLDARISKGRGLRTAISHAETKTMTHFLRSHHDGILVGSGTALSDDPGLNCKWVSKTRQASQLADISPRPIILDPQGKWRFKGSMMESLYLSKNGKSPIVVVTKFPEVRDPNVAYMQMDRGDDGLIDWNTLFNRLYLEYNMKSIMVEGGAMVINALLMRPELVGSLIVTLGAVYLGAEGVQVSPPKQVDLVDVNWWKGSRDGVLCARLYKV
ncbi:2,5-diamino-6-(ribosylamino)-4(3H)-pyrimidinone 5'-phosphate reductase Ecym_5336 [Eremothecium cymbalariae DBVPG|uniref:2,5-diamino-6-ribosylamino-4(3H)-pyrimidinone 5'-phosphate reductase n=1 Tax=Eremothecium cymbalariae (strain CBS 270.75 / DBVPG 7215 / KCTC 17166 / NRRL Y-17582) TaxID=931890 RepID=I6NDF3_ERECY|nr:hypothetical protein Ecym_5336 [Eremothecium cymbalariae DBVPG\